MDNNRLRNKVLEDWFRNLWGNWRWCIVFDGILKGLGLGELLENIWFYWISNWICFEFEIGDENESMFYVLKELFLGMFLGCF